MARVCRLFAFIISAGLIQAGDFGGIHDPLTHAITWVVEQQPCGTVSIRDGLMSINDSGGCTVWFVHKMTAPVYIRYEARVLSSGRLSDLNCFWMASDPKQKDLFVPGHKRDGLFSSYDSLQTYYVGFGGNNNTTTRFRRYDGTGSRPLRPEHDRREHEHLLKPDHWYQIDLAVKPGGHVEFAVDGETVFEFADPAPLTSGWFGIRTVNSRIEVRNFYVTFPAPEAPPTSSTRGG